MLKKLLCLCLLAPSVGAFATVRLPSILGSNMVLQQNSTVKLHGWAGVGEKIYITTSWDHRTDSTTGTSDAEFVLSLKTPAAGGPYTITFKASNTIVLTNVLIGEVWLGSGQSNMEMTWHWGLPDVQAELPTASHPSLRFFTVSRSSYKYPKDDVTGQWVVCDSNTVKDFGGAAFFFGKSLQQQLQVPVGIINSSWGGSPAEVWTPEDVVAKDAALTEAVKKSTPNPYSPNKTGYVFNGMIAPLLNTPIAGVIWYQGESNVGRSDAYQHLFTTMIEGWRKAWHQDDLPFYFVQIAPFRYGADNQAALLREAQAQSLSSPKTGMVVITDLDIDTSDIHPKNKHGVGNRLAALALSEVYNKPLTGIYSPLYKSMRVEKDKVVITFDHAADGLQFKGKAATELFIAGADKVFYPATAKVVNEELQVWSKSVKAPVAVRYAFTNTSIGNIFSKKDMPVGPFRTDNWEMDQSQVK